MVIMKDINRALSDKEHGRFLLIEEMTYKREGLTRTGSVRAQVRVVRRESSEYPDAVASVIEGRPVAGAARGLHSLARNIVSKRHSMRIVE